MSIFIFIRRILFISYNQFDGNRPHNRPQKYNGDMVNETIRFPEVLVIGPDGQQLGKMRRNDALTKAYSLNLDLLCVAPNATPPVCKIVDYGKFHFQAQKKAKEAKKNQHIVEIREIQLTPQIGDNDLKTKAKKAREFLEDGSKIKLGVRFRGRQLAHIELGQEVINRFIALIEDVGTLDKGPTLEGRWLNSVIVSKIKK